MYYIKYCNRKNHGNLNSMNGTIVLIFCALPKNPCVSASDGIIGTDDKSVN